MLGDEIYPGPALRSAHSRRELVRRTVSHCYHPVGSCKMGPATDPAAVVDPRGRVHGLDGCVIADASIMPVVPRANTHLPAVLVGERMAAFL
jgi:choline dehydrogenase